MASKPKRKIRDIPECARTWEDTYRGHKADLMWSPASPFAIMAVRQLFRRLAGQHNSHAFLELAGADKDGAIKDIDMLSERGADALLRCAELYFRSGRRERS